MQTTYSTAEKSFRIIAFLFSSIVLITQFVLMMQGAAESGEMFIRLVRFFSFMTILTNIIVALAYILPLIASSSKARKLFATPNAQCAVCMYIVMVCVGYHFMLSKLYTLVGLQYYVDRGLHYVVPVLYVLFYLLFVKKGTLVYRNIYKWLMFPFVYLVYVVVRGFITNDYPYPFLNFSKHEASKVFTSIAILFAGYILMSLLIVLFDRIVSKKS
ncbi:Pr6Pr family membrane protein [soil metagenome]